MAGVAVTRRAPDGKRDAILQAALDLFGRYGYRRTSIDDIARAAGIAKGTVYLYVANKEALFRTLSQSLLARVLDAATMAARAERPLADRLEAILEAKFGFFHDLLHRSPHAGELLDSTSRLCADVFADGDAAYLKILTKVIAEATRRGELAPRRHGLTADDAARLLVAGARGIAAEPAVALTGTAHRTRLSALVRVVVDGMRSR